MPSQCPPGVICFENGTILLIIIIGICALIYTLNHTNKNNIFVTTPPSHINNITTSPDDVLLNPITPPLRNNNYLPKIGGDIRGLPINIPTQGYSNVEYRQVGILTRINGPEQILPLMGRPTLTNRDKWNFYTMKDGNQMIKLPITHRGKSCTNEYGCDNLYNGDTVYVEGYNDAFKVTSYDNQVMHYIPYV